MIIKSTKEDCTPLLNNVQEPFAERTDGVKLLNYIQDVLLPVLTDCDLGEPKTYRNTQKNPNQDTCQTQTDEVLAQKAVGCIQLPY